MEQWKNTIRCRKGNVMLYGMAFICFLGIFFLLCYQREEVNLVLEEVQRDITTTLTSTGSNMLAESFQPVRDGTSGSHIFNGASFTEIQDTSKFLQRYTQIYKQAVTDGTNITKYYGTRPIFKISNIRLYVENGGKGKLKSNYYCEYDLYIYTDRLWEGKELLLEGQKQKVEYKNKF